MKLMDNTQDVTKREPKRTRNTWFCEGEGLWEEDLVWVFVCVDTTNDVATNKDTNVMAVDKMNNKVNRRLNARPASGDTGGKVNADDPDMLAPGDGECVSKLFKLCVCVCVCVCVYEAPAMMRLHN
jgi:hypothetical protein